MNSDTLDTHLTRASFWPTLGHYARLHSVCPQHLADTLRLAGQPGVPVTARLVFDTARALAASGFTVAPAPACTGPSDAVLAAELATSTTETLPVPKPRQPPRTARPRAGHARPAPRHSIGR